MRFSPRQSDLMIVAATYKMYCGASIYEQMPEPKWVIAMGACASSEGMYRSYATLQGVDRILPVDVYISGCPMARSTSRGVDEAAKQNFERASYR